MTRTPEDWRDSIPHLHDALAEYHASEGHEGTPWANAALDIKKLSEAVESEIQKAKGEVLDEAASALMHYCSYTFGEDSTYTVGVISALRSQTQKEPKQLIK